jgi:hypothetical protein
MKRGFIQFASALVDDLSDIMLVDDDAVKMKRKRPKVARKTILDFERETSSFSGKFRFRSGDQLRRLLLAFQFPEGEFSIKRSKFTSEEVLLISLTRLAYPLRWQDIEDKFGRYQSELSNAFYWFLDFMIEHWAYLLVNNREYWLDHLEASAEAIRQKLMTLPNQENRLVFPPAYEDNGFRIALFIDNTMLAINRPGGGPSEAGEQARRPSSRVQRAWWTGWKKLHGLKWQTVTLANGMDFEVFGPRSVRRNDSYTLDKSNIEEKLHVLQLGRRRVFGMFGDSAYFPTPYLSVANSKGMSAVRQTIEWSYKDLKTIWKFLDWKRCLKLRKQPIAKIAFVAMILRNAHVTLNACQTAEYMQMIPPTLEEWLSQGPRAHELPDDFIFSPNYNPELDDADSDDEDEWEDIDFEDDISEMSDF